MRTSFSHWVVLASLACGTAARADNNDFMLTNLGNPDEGEAGYSATANTDFQAFSRAFAAVMTSANLTPPETLGHAAFAVNAELSVLGLPKEITLPTQRTQSDTLLIPSVHFRKGLPFSMEVGARVGWVDRSSMFAATGEFKVAINEGFAWLPDVAARAHVTHLFNQRDFSLTAAGLDFGVGKQFALGGMVTLTPYAGWDLVGVAAGTNTLDFQPTRTYDSTLESPYAGLANTAVYKPVHLMENVNSRFYGGARFIGGVFQIGAEVSLTQLGTIPGVAGVSADRSLPGVFAFNTTLGLDF